MCTAVIVSSHKSGSGKPILLKHRDLPYDEYATLGNAVGYIESKRFGKRGILAVTNISGRRKSPLCGINSSGFAIVNTATYNLGPRNFNTQIPPSVVICEALSKCSCIGEFEKLLDNFYDKLMPANYGVIDDSGRTYYYEACNYKIEREDQSNWERGYKVFTNYSYSGDYENRPGTDRCIVTEEIMKRSGSKPISVDYLFNEISRSYANNLLGFDLKRNGNPFGEYFIDGLTIPLRSTTFSAVIEGNILWVSLGYPPVSAVIPFVMGMPIPDTSEVTSYFSALRNAIFDINVGEGNSYFHFSKLYNMTRTGWMQLISDLEYDSLKNFNRDMDETELSCFYHEYFMRISDLYRNILKEENLIEDSYKHYKLCTYGERKDRSIPVVSIRTVRDDILTIIRKSVNGRK